MTTTEMIQAFNISYDIVNLQGPGYEPEEILVFLNQAQSIEVLKEVSIKRFSYISYLINDVGLVLLSDSIPAYKKHLDPAYDMIAYLNSKTKLYREVFKSFSTPEWIPNILIRQEESGPYITNSLNRPILLNPRVYLNSDSGMSLLYDYYTTIYASTGASDYNFYLEYVRKPSDITETVNSIVDPVLHERIVNTAVDIAKKVWNPQEAGISQQTDNLMKNPEA